MKALIVDDEKHCIDNLALLLGEFCPDVEILDTAHSAQQGLEAFKREKPDILFLDVQMPKMNGFEMLKELDVEDVALVFVTAFDSYAIHAIELSPCGYLLKPIDSQKLISAVSKAKEDILLNGLRENYNRAVELVVESANENRKSGKISLRSNNKIEIVDIDNIVYLNADNYYTSFHIDNGKTILMSKTLKHYSSALPDGFLRVHRSYLAALNHIVELQSDKNNLLMSNGDIIPISRRQLSYVRDAIKNQ